MKKKLVVVVGGGYIAIRSARKRGLPGQLGAALTGDPQVINELAPKYGRELSVAELALWRADNPQAQRLGAREIGPVSPTVRRRSRRVVFIRNVRAAREFLGELFSELMDLPVPTEDDLATKIDPMDSLASHEPHDGRSYPVLPYPRKGDRFGLSPATGSQIGSFGEFPY